MSQVSPMTVTRVLRGHNTVAHETRQRVLEAVRQTDYVPIRSAVQNRHVTNNVLGYVPYHVDLTQNRIDSETYTGISYAAYQHDYDVLVMLRKESDWMASRAELRFLDRRSDGFVFLTTYCGEWESVLNALVEHAIPTVVCYRRDVPQGIAWVDPDNEAITRLGVEALLKKGHRRIAYVTAPDHYKAKGRLAQPSPSGGNYDDLERRRVFRRLMQQEYSNDCNGIIIENKQQEWKVESNVLRSIRDQNITGIVCMNDLTAMRLWNLAESAGLRIPEDLSIIGVDNTKEAEQVGLTSIGFRFSDVGAAAV
ncbi:MAG: LacI family transcriptional regulator, partial [Proteobacteria bacterium]